MLNRFYVVEVVDAYSFVRESVFVLRPFLTLVF